MAGSVFDLRIRMGIGKPARYVTMIDPEKGSLEDGWEIARRVFGAGRVLDVKKREEKIDEKRNQGSPHSIIDRE